MRGFVERDPATLCRERDDGPVGLVGGLEGLRRVAPQRQQEQPQHYGDAGERPVVLPRPCGQQEQQHDREAAEELGVGLEALHDGQALWTFDIQQGLAPLKCIDRVLCLERGQGAFLNLNRSTHRKVALALEHQPHACADRPAQHTPSASDMPDLPIQRPVAQPVVDAVQRRAEQEDQVAEEVAGEQENGPGFGAGERCIAIPQHNRASYTQFRS